MGTFLVRIGIAFLVLLVVASAQDCTHQETGAVPDGTTITLQDGCTECSCSSGVMTCTDTCKCDMEEFRKCYEEKVDILIIALLQPDKQFACEKLPKVDECIARQMENCKDRMDPMDLLLSPFSRILTTQTEQFCTSPFVGNEVDEAIYRRAADCVRGFPKIASLGSLPLTCQQGRRSAVCLREISEDVPEPYKSLLTLISSTLSSSAENVCPYDSCQLGTAERCIYEAKKYFSMSVYREEMGLECGFFRSALKCAVSHSKSCGVDDDEWEKTLMLHSLMTDEHKDDGDDKDDRNQDDAKNQALLDYLKFISKHKDTCPSLQEEQPDEMMEEHLAEAMDRVKELIQELDGIVGAASIKAVLESLREFFLEELTITLEITGTKLMLAKETMKGLLERYEAVMEKIDREEIELDVAAEAVLAEVKDLKAQLELLFQSIVTSFESRIHHVRQEVLNLHLRISDMCKEETMERHEMEPWNQIFFMFSSIMNDPLSKPEQVCGFLPDIKTAVHSMMDWNEELGDEVMKSVNDSLKLLHLIFKDICDETEEEEACVDPPAEETNVCNIANTGDCSSSEQTRAIIVKIQEIESSGSEEFGEVCSDVRTILQCIYNETKGCAPDELGQVNSTMRAYKMMVPGYFECDFDNLDDGDEPPVCEEEPQCNAQMAETCFKGLDEYIDVCGYTKEGVHKCLEPYIGACSLSVSLVPMEFMRLQYLKRYQDKIDEEECEHSLTSLFLDDPTLPLAECNLLFYQEFLKGMKEYGSSQDALCSSFVARDMCIKEAHIPFLMEIFEWRRKELFRESWTEVCGSWTPPEPMDEDADVPGPDLTGCDIDAAVGHMLMFDSRSTNLFGFHTSTPVYGEACSEAHLEDLKTQLRVAFSDTCILPAQEPIDFLTKIHAEFCRFPIHPEPEQCCVECVRQCLRDFGAVGGISSPHGSICGALKDSLGCVTKYNKNCDVSQLATIKTELSMAEAFIGSHTCDLEEWCNTDLDEEQDVVSDPTANAFCGDPPQCLEFYACVKETKEETCTNVQEVRDCIEATSQDCPIAMKALLKKLIEGYQTVSLEDNCVIIPQIIGDQDFTGYTCQINIFKDDSATYCSSLGEYIQCLDPPADSINYLYAYEEGARRVLIELYSNLYHDMCSTDDKMDEEDEDDTVVCPNLEAAKLSIGAAFVEISEFPWNPDSYRSVLCESLYSISQMVKTMLEDCSGRDVDKLNALMEKMVALKKFIGMCAEELVDRDCKPWKAQECLEKLTHSAIQNWQHNYYVCSQANSFSSCVAMATLGCEGHVKKPIYQALSEVMYVVDDYCKPMAPPDTSVMCELREGESHCSLAKAASCMLQLNTRPEHSKPNWETFCPNVPALKACIYRNTRDCEDCDKDIAMRWMHKMADQLEEHCPEVHCEICQAYECLEELNMDEKQDDFCRSFDKASQCVLNKTQNCSKEIAGDVLKKLEDIKPKAMKACMMEMKECVVHFEESVLSVVAYKGDKIDWSSEDDDDEPERPVESGSDGDDEKGSGSSGRGSGSDSTGGESDTSSGQDDSDSDSDGSNGGSGSDSNGINGGSGSNGKGDKGSKGSEGSTSSISSSSNKGSKADEEESIGSGMDEDCDFYVYEPMLLIDKILNKKLQYWDMFNGDWKSDDREEGSPRTDNDDKIPDDETDDNMTDENQPKPKRTCVIKPPVRPAKELRELCGQLSKSWECVHEHIFLLEEGDVRDAFNDVLFSLLQMAREKCTVKPLQCHSCDGAKTHEECDAQGLQTCQGNQKMVCMSQEVYGKDAHVSKRCVKQDECKADSWCTEQWCKKCCDGHACNWGVGKPEVKPPEEGGITCYSCKDESDNDACNQEEAEICSHNKQGCLTTIRIDVNKGNKKHITKKCKNPTAGRNLVKYKETPGKIFCNHFCEKDLCNTRGDCDPTADDTTEAPTETTTTTEAPDTFVSLPMCAPYKQLVCGMHYVHNLLDADFLDCSKYFDALNCMSEQLPDCKEESWYGIYNYYVMKLKNSHRWAECLYRERAWNCGSNGVATLFQVLNTFASKDTICMHFNTAYHAWWHARTGMCEDSDIESVFTDLSLANSILSGTCQIQTPQVPIIPTDGVCKVGDRTYYPGESYPDAEICNMCACGENGPAMCTLRACLDTGDEPLPCTINGQEVESGKYIYDTDSCNKCFCRNGEHMCEDRKVKCGPPGCKEGVDVTECTISPCDPQIVTCSNHPAAFCRESYCGGCHAQFILEEEDVTSSCNPPDLPSECLAVLDTGNEECEGEEEPSEKWYLSSETETCEQFMCTGCGGNSNKFDTRELCGASCMPRCYSGMHAGDCDREIPAWYFDSEEGKCKEFDFTGCGGSDNRFASEYECYESCGVQSYLEKMCDEAEEKIAHLVGHYKLLLEYLAVDNTKLACFIFHEFVMPKVKKELDTCLISRRLEIKEELLEDVNRDSFDAAKCMDDYENNKDVVPDFLPCQSNEVIQNQCLSAAGTGCGARQTVVDCVKSLTVGCNPVQIQQINKVLEDKLEDIEVTDTEACEYNLPELSETYESFLTCTDNVLKDFKDALLIYLDSESPRSICDVASSFKKCVFKIADLPAKKLVSDMVKRSWHIYEHFSCADFEPEKPLPDQIQCYTCKNEQDNAACNGSYKTCNFNQQSCISTVKKHKIKGETYIEKGCTNKLYEGSKQECWKTPSKMECYYTCNDHLCNEPLFLESGQGGSGGGGGGGGGGGASPPDEPPLCLASFPVIVNKFIEEMFLLGFDHRSDQEAICSNQANVRKTLLSFHSGCEGQFTTQIDSLSNLLEEIYMSKCIPAVDEEEPGDDVLCDWRSCVSPIIPYLASKHEHKDHCSDFLAAKKCLREMIFDNRYCDESQRIDVGKQVLELILDIVGTSGCALDLQTFICEAKVADPTTVCDVEEAIKCTSYNEASDFAGQEDQCRSRKNVLACLAYYTDYCPSDTPGLTDADTTVRNDVSEWDCTGLNIEATFDPNACPEPNTDLCHVTDAIDKAATFVISMRGVTDDTVICGEVLAVKERMKSKLYGCNAIQRVTPLFALIQGAKISTDTCTISLGLSIDDYLSPQVGCVHDFMNNIKDVYEDPSTSYTMLCSKFNQLMSCLASTESDISLFKDIMKKNIDLAQEFTDSCEMPDTVQESTPEAGCNYWSYGHCVLIKGMPYLLGPLMPLKEKEHLCETRFSKLIVECEQHIDACTTHEAEDAISNRLVEFFNRISTMSIMCEEPKPPCSPSNVVDLASVLGQAVSQHIDDESMFSHMCESLECAESVLEEQISDCGASMTQTAMSSWHDTRSIAEKVCKPMVPPPVPSPMPMPQPIECVPADYYDPMGGCNIGLALSCIAKLKGHVFDMAGTESGFCFGERKTVTCFLQHTNCPGELVNAVTPSILDILHLFDGRCTVFCDSVEKPKFCDIMAASEHYKELENLDKDEDKCRMVKKTKMNIHEETKDCTGGMQFLAGLLIKKAQMLSWRACIKEEEEPKPSDDDCLEKYKKIGLELMDFIFHAEEKDDDADNTGTENKDDSPRGDTSAGGSGSSGRGSDTGSGGGSGRGSDTGSDTGSGSSGRGSDSGSDTGSGSGNSDRPDKDEFVWSWLTEEEKGFERAVSTKCGELKKLWMCVEDHLAVMKRFPFKYAIHKLIIEGIKDVVMDKCRPQECHTCVDLDDNDECNAQETCHCPLKEQMCYSKYNDGHYVKGCTSEEMCDECNEQENCYCCRGRKCNKKGYIDDEDHPVCEIRKGVECAISVIYKSWETDEVTYSLIGEALECIVEHTEDCSTETYYHLYLRAMEIIKMFKENQCVRPYGDPNCGIRGILAFAVHAESPFYSHYSLCGQHKSTLESIELLKIQDTCSGEKLDLIEDSFHLLNDQLNGYCSASSMGECQIQTAIETCIIDRSWYDPQTCSFEMFEGFRDCCFEYLGDCSQLVSNRLYFTAQQVLKDALDNCVNEITFDIQQILDETFYLDEYTKVQIEFVTEIKRLMLGSFDFIADSCSRLTWLQEKIRELEISMSFLQKYFNENVNTIIEAMKEKCEGPSVTEEDIKEECTEPVDIVILLDSSSSVGEEAFEKVKEFAKLVIKTVDVEKDRVAVLQFASEVNVNFQLDEHIGNRDDMLEAVDGIEYIKGKTNTAEALNVAVTLLSESKGGRPDVQKLMIVVADGIATVNPEGVNDAAIKARNAATLIAVAVNMSTEAAKDHIKDIAGSWQFVVHIEDFEGLREIYLKVLIAKCRESALSTCDYRTLVLQSSEMLFSSSFMFASFDNDGARICRQVDDVFQSINSLSMSCSNYQSDVLKLVEKMVRAQTRKTCVAFTTDVVALDCDIPAARAIVNEFSQFLKRDVENTILCPIIPAFLSRLDHSTSGCTDKTEIKGMLGFSSTILLNRCEEAKLLRCWGTHSDSGTGGADEYDEGGDAGSTGCSIDSLLECLPSTDAFDFVSLLQCEDSLLSSVVESAKCLFDKFTERKCNVPFFTTLRAWWESELNPIRISFVACPDLVKNIPTIPDLPSDYGASEVVTCEKEPICNWKAAYECLQTLEDDCGNLEEVKECIATNLADCNDFESFSTEVTGRMKMIEQDCNVNALVDQTAVLAFVPCTLDLLAAVQDDVNVGGKPVCTAYLDYLDCLDDVASDSQAYLNGYRDELYAAVRGSLEYYCHMVTQPKYECLDYTEADQTENDDELDESALCANAGGIFTNGENAAYPGCDCSCCKEEEPIPEVEEDTCDVEKALRCLFSYMIPALNAPALSKASKEHVCESYGGQLACLNDTVRTCSQQNKLLEIYELTEMIVFLSEICSPVPYLCSPHSAMAFISELSQRVTMFGVDSDDTEEDICLSTKHTRHMVDLMLRKCEADVQAEVVWAYKEIECMAKDICTKLEDDEEDPEEEPQECVDPAEVQEGATCDIYEAFGCLEEFLRVDVDSFAKNNKKACLSYAAAMKCAYKNSYDCPERQKVLLEYFIKEHAQKKADHLECKTKIRTPCEEEDDCGMEKAMACIKEFKDNLDDYTIQETVCLHLEEVRHCIDTNIVDCSTTAKETVEAAYKDILDDLGELVCDETLISCSLKYVHFVTKIFQWKTEILVIDEETESCTEQSSAKSEKSDKSPKSGKSGTPKESTQKSGTPKSGKSGTPKESTQKSGTPKESTQKSGTPKSGKSGTPKESTQKSGTPKSTQSEKSPKSEKSTQSEESETCETGIDWTIYWEQLTTFCEHLDIAWECVIEKWSVLPENTKVLVEETYRAYHQITVDICTNHRMGICPNMDLDKDFGQCSKDEDCVDERMKCCSTVCLIPEVEEPACFNAFVFSTTSIFSLVTNLIVEENGRELFCESYVSSETTIAESLTYCPQAYGHITSVSKILVAAQTTYKTFCSGTLPDTTCDEDEIKNCITKFEDASSDEKCSEFDIMEKCVNDILEQCNPVIKKEMIDDNRKRLENIYKTLDCQPFPKFVVPNDKDNILIKEGDLPGWTCDVKLDSDLTKLCPADATPETCYVLVTASLEDDGFQCKEGSTIPQVVGNLCDMIFTTQNSETSQQFNLSAVIDHQVDGPQTATFTILASLVIDGVLAQEKELAKYSLIIEDMDRAKQCNSLNDPHISTCDGLIYDAMMKNKMFVMYRHDLYDFEVRTYFSKCGGDEAAGSSCNCGVFIKVCDDVFELNKCPVKPSDARKTQIHTNNELCEGFRVFKNPDGKEWQIHLPNGARMNIIIEEKDRSVKGNRYLINLFMYPSPVDIGKIKGLWGNYDSPKYGAETNKSQGNDLTGPDDVEYPIDSFNYVKPYDRAEKILRPDGFTKTWRVKKNEVRFLKGVLPNSNAKTVPKTSCKTVDGQCKCSLENFLSLCDPPSPANDVTERLRLGEEVRRRRKRAVVDPMDGMPAEDDVYPVFTPYPTKSGITFEMANQTCYKALMEADFAALCLSVIPEQEFTESLRNCYMDILLQDKLDTVFINTAREALRKRCQFVIGTEQNKTASDALKSVSCVKSCSGQGVCNDGVCECNANFDGLDCSINVNDPPLADYLDQTHCIFNSLGQCTLVIVNGDKFVQGYNISCHLQKVNVLETGIDITDEVTIIPAEFESFDEVFCDISRYSTSPLYGFLVSVSNNGLTTGQSEQHLYVAHNEKCWKCQVTDGNQASCVREPRSCLVDGVCYEPLESKADNPCYKCDDFTQKLEYFISDACPALTEPTEPTTMAGPNIAARKMNDALVIGLSSAVAVLVLIILAIVIAIVVYKHRRGPGGDKKRFSYSSSDSSNEVDVQDFRNPALISNYGFYALPAPEYAAPREYIYNIPLRQNARQPDNATTYVQYPRAKSPQRHHHDSHKHERSSSPRRDLRHHQHRDYDI